MAVHSLSEEHRRDIINSPAFKFCQELCGQYEWSAEPWRAKTRNIIHAFMTYFEGYDPVFRKRCFQAAVFSACGGR